MRVIHYIRDFSDTTNDTISMVKSIMVSTAKVTECHLLTVVPLAESMVQAMSEQYGITVHYLTYKDALYPVRTYAQGRQAKRLMKSIAPDIVHIYGSWDGTAATVERKARSRNIVTIVSPLNGLSTVNLNTSFWKQKLPRLALYQAWMVRRCTAVVAISDQERADIQSIRLKSRIETLHSENIQELGESIMAIYRKALDSSYLNYITHEEKQFVRDSVRNAISKEDSPVSIIAANDLSYRRIYLYAYDEDAIDLLIEGAKKASIPMPPVLNVAELPRYKTKKAKLRISLYDVKVQFKKRLREDDHSKEMEAVRLIAAAYQTKLKRLTLKQWSELYNLFRNIDFDEDIAAEELKRQKLKKFTKKLQKKLGKYYDLPQGFDIY